MSRAEPAAAAPSAPPARRVLPEGGMIRLEALIELTLFNSSCSSGCYLEYV